MRKGDQVEVQFVDYGNYSIVPLMSVQPMLAEFLQLPSQALCCSLVGLQQAVAWSAAEIDTLFNMLQDDSYTIMCSSSSLQGDSWPVEILDHNGHNINQLFGQKTGKLSRINIAASPPRTFGERSANQRSDFAGGRQSRNEWGTIRANENSERTIENGSSFEGNRSSGFQRNGEGFQRKQENNSFQPRQDNNSFPLKRESNFSQRESAGGFGQRDAAASSFGQRDAGGGFGQRNTGGGFGQRDTADNFGKNNDRGGFQRRDNENASFGRKEGNYGGFQRRENENELSRRDEAGFSRRNDGGRFQKRDNEGGFQKRDNEGGFQKRDNEGGFQKRDNEGGFQKRDNEGGFQKRDNEGGFTKRDNENGGFRRRENEGNFQKREGFSNSNQNRERTGFQRKDGEENGGFKKRENNFGGDRKFIGDNRQGGERRGFGNNKSGFGTEIEQSKSGNTASSSEDWGEPNAPAVTTVSLSACDIKSLSFSAGAAINVYVSFIINPSVFWCQTVAGSTPLEQFMASMRKELERPDEFAPVNAAKVGEFYYSCYSEDGQWYRGQVISVQNGNAEILFVDYGNSESVPVTQLKKLLPKHSELPAQAFKCSLSGMEPVTGGDWSAESISKFEELVMEQELSCKIITVDRKHFEVELTVGDSKIREQMINEGFAKAVSVKQIKPISDCSETFTSLNIGQFYDVSLVYINTPDYFACQLLKRNDELSALMEKLHNDYESGSPELVATQKWQPGEMCCCKFSSDQEWYRGKVLESNEDKVRVYFLDYGNEEWACISDVRLLRDEYRTHPSFAYICSLANVKPVEIEWSEEAVNMLEELTIDKALVAQVISSESEGKVRVTIMEVKEEGKFDVGNELVKRNLAYHVSGTATTLTSSAVKVKDVAARKAIIKPYAVKSGETKEAIVSFVTSITNIAVQLNDRSSALDALTETIQAQAESLAGTTCQQGDYCLAQYSVDGAWYRAVVEEVQGDTVTVKFVDFGNTDILSMQYLKLLPSELAVEPTFALDCCFNELSAVTTLDVEAVRALLEGQEFTVEFISESTPYKIKLWSGENCLTDSMKPTLTQPYEKVNISTNLQSNSVVKYISSALVPLPVSSRLDVVVAYVESPAKFWIQQKKLLSNLQQQQDSIQLFYGSEQTAAVDNVEAGGVYVCQCIEDECWYRCRVAAVESEGFTVFYLDYGNCETVTVDRLKNLVEKFASLPPQAVECILADVSAVGDSWSDEAYDHFQTNVLDKTLLAVIVNINETGVHTVRLFDMGMSVADKLVEAGLAECMSKSDTDSLVEQTEQLQLCSTPEKKTKTRYNWELQNAIFYINLLMYSFVFALLEDFLFSILLSYLYFLSVYCATRYLPFYCAIHYRPYTVSYFTFFLTVSYFTSFLLCHTLFSFYCVTLYLLSYCIILYLLFIVLYVTFL